MRQALATAAALAVAAIAFMVTTRDPEQASNVALVVVAFAVLVGSLAALALAGRRPPRARSAGVPPAALRRGIGIGAAAGFLAFLRVLDGLTPLTLAFVAAAFVAAEYVLSGRRVRSRR